MRVEGLKLIVMFTGQNPPLTFAIHEKELGKGLQALIAALGDGTPSPLCPVHVTSEIDPRQDADEGIQ